MQIYDNWSARAYYEAVTTPGRNPNEAVYYLIRHRLTRALGQVYSLHGFGLIDEFEDTVDDFFLYLYEGQDQAGPPFSILNGVQNKQAFFGWTVATYRNFLLNKAKEENRRKALLDRLQHVSPGEPKPLSDETMVERVATAIAYGDQHLSARNRFVFYRMILTLLDPHRAIPQEEVAQALNMHPVTYRVCTNRQKTHFSDYILQQELGMKLPLDEVHQGMRERIEDEFCQLYPLLMEYYEQSIPLLPSALEINALRLRHAHEDKPLMHEGNGYGFRNAVNVKRLYWVSKSYVTS